MLSTIPIILLALRFKSRFYLSVNENPTPILVLLAKLFFALVNGYVMGRLYDFTFREGSFINPNSLLLSFGVLVFGFTILKDFLPVYKPKLKLVGSVYPLSRWEKIIIGNSIQLLSSYYFLIFIFLISVKLNSENLAWIKVFEILMMLFTAHCILQAIKTMLEFKTFLKPVLIFLLIVWTVGFFMAHITGGSFSFFTTAILLILACAYYILCEFWTLEYNFVYSNGYSLSGNLYTNLILRHRHVSVLFFVFFIGKVLFFIFETTLEYTMDEPRELLLYPGGYCMVISPYFFAMISNNTFGLHRGFWLKLNLAPMGNWDILKMYMRLNLPFIIIDFLITFLYLAFSRSFYFDIILFYLISCFFLYLIGFISSVFFPRIVNKAGNFKSPSSDLIGFLDLAIVSLLAMPILNHMFYYLVLLMLVPLPILFIYTLNKIPEQKYLIYNILFKRK